jgi:outer membrane protein TolC
MYIINEKDICFMWLSIFQLTLKKRIFGSLLVVLYVCSFKIYAAVPVKPLSIFEAEQLAIVLSPELRRLNAEAEALDQKAIADGQLPDPSLMAGTINVPTNTFSFKQDDMTMIMGGLEQKIPPGHSLAIQSRQTKAQAGVFRAQLKEQELVIVRTVQETWLELYYLQHEAEIIRSNRQLFAYLHKVAQSQYAAAKATQTDVLQVQIELTHLDVQQVQIAQQIDQSRAKLGRWIGQENARRKLSAQLPKFPKVPPLNLLKVKIQRHPLLQADLGAINASREAIAFSKEQFKPGLVLDVNYGVRQGHMENGVPRSDMITAQASIDLPIFTKHRQTPRLRESLLHLEAAILDRNTHYRDLNELLISTYAAWTQLGKRNSLITNKLVPQSKQNAKASLLAYQNATLDMNTVLRAYTGQLDIKLEQLQIQIEQLKSRAALLYLQGIK